MHGEENEAVRKNIENVKKILETFFSIYNEVTIGFNGNDILVNDQRLKSPKGVVNYLDKLTTLFLSLHVGNIQITSNFNIDDLVYFCKATNNFPYGPEGDTAIFNQLQTLLTASNSTISISHYTPITDQMPPIIDKEQMARQIYTKMIADFDFFQEKVEQKAQLPIKKAVRNIQTIIDLLLDSEDDRQWNNLLTMASLNCFRGKYIATHAANTTILSVAMGITLGQKKSVLKTIGLSAYFHDIAIEDIESEIIESSETHAERSFNILSKLNSLNLDMMEASMIAANHHNSYDFDGEAFDTPPEMRDPIEEIVKVADYYDIAIKWWPDHKKRPITKTKAVRNIIEHSKKGVFLYDVANALFATTGIFPPGTLMKIKSENLYALSYGNFFNYDTNAEVFLLDSDFNLIDKGEYSANELFELPAEYYLKITPKTYTSIFTNLKGNYISL